MQRHLLQFALVHNFTIKITCFTVQWYTALLQQCVSVGSGTVICCEGNVFQFEVVKHSGVPRIFFGGGVNKFN